MRNASDAQVRYLEAWSRAFRSELEEVLSSHGLSSTPFDEIEMSQASLVIAEMVAKYGKPKNGKNEQGQGQHRGDGDGQGENGLGQGEGNGQGEGDQGNGDGEGQGQGQDEGQDGDGDSGDGDGDGDDGNGNDNGGQMDQFKEGSKEQVVAQALLDNDMNKQRAYEQIKDDIGSDPLEFKQNSDGGRIPLPMGSDSDRSSDKTQKGRARKLINDTYKKMLEHQEQNGGGQGQGNGQGQQQHQYMADALLAKINEAREICEKMNADGEPFDTVGLRPYEYGARMLANGLPVPAIIDSMTMTWPVEVRRELAGKKMSEFDHSKFKHTEHDMPPEVIQERLAPLAKATDGKSSYLPALVALAESRVPIMQVGEKGTGKTTNAAHLAEALSERWGREMRFGFASMTSGTSPGEFKGRITLEGFLPSLFESIYEDGGVFLFDELDAGDENLLTLLNSALANGNFVNQQGKVIEQSEYFIPMAAANTMGLGANGRYTGRNRLDAATLDRWALGRIRIQFDQQLAEFMYWTQLAGC